ncbi:30S ribosomal protein S2 [Candidatus Shapirobacteria bacterium]|nr:MAG: 30S ribosomal protein S2 [Candidatus Shapirobacteria bacterium]
MKKKTVNLTGKEIAEDKLVMKSKATKEKEKKEAIKKKNEALLRKAEVSKKTKEVEKKDKKEIVKKEKKLSYKLSIGMEDLFKAGCHLGHSKSKTNPKARENIYTTKNKVEIFDLAKTVKALEEAGAYLKGVVKRGEKVIFVGTKRQAREVVKRMAMEVNMPYVTDRWLGGTMTNWEQIKKNITRLASLKEGIKGDAFQQKTKKEQSVIRKEITRLERIVGGLVSLEKIPEAIFVVDVGTEKTAVREAKRLGVKVIGICDSDTDPAFVDIAIPANDDNVKSITIIVEEIIKAIKD